MGTAPGQNAGISGYVSFPGKGGKWQCRVYLVGDSWNLDLIDDAGRGDGEWPAQLPGNASGTIVLTGEVMQNACPNPTDFNGATGTLTKVYWQGREEEVPIRVFKRGTSFKEKDAENYQITLTCQILDIPTLEGWPGDQPSDSVDAPEDKKLWTGMRKVGDPNGIGVSAAERLRVWGVGDTDAAEITELESHFSDTTPYTGLKLLPLTMERASANIVYLNFMWGVADTKQQIEFPGTVNTDDSSDLEDQKTFALVQNSSTPTPPSTPSGLKLVDTNTTQITNSGLYVHRFLYARRTRQEAIEMDGSPQSIDSSNLGDTWTFTLVKSSATPAAPSTPDGYVLLDTLIVQRHAATTGQKWIHTYKYSRITRAKAMEFEGTSYGYDASARNIGEISRIRVITTALPADVTGSPPNLDTTFSGKVISFDAQPLTTSQGAYDGYWQYTWLIGPNDRYDEIVNQGAREFDPASIGTAESIFETTTTTTPPTPTPSDTDLKLTRRQMRRRQADPALYEWRFDYARNTRQDEIEHTGRGVDPDHFGESEKIPLVHTSGTSSPGTPSPVNTTQLIGYNVERLCVASGSFTGLWVWTFLFGPTTKKQEIEQQGAISTDPQALDDDDVQTLTNTSSSDPGPPAARISGQVLIRTEARKIQNTPLKWEFKYVFGWRTSTGQLVAEHTRTLVDRSTIPTESTADTAERWLVSGGAPGTPTLSGYVLASHVDVELKNPLYRMRVYTWALFTPQQQKEFSQTRAKADPFDLYQYQVATRISDSTSTVNQYAQGQLTLAANRTDNTFDGVEVIRETPSALLKILTYSGEHQKIHSSSVNDSLYPYWGAPAVGWPDEHPEAWGTTTGRVKVAAPGLVVGGPGGFTYGYIMQEEHRRNIERFTVRMRYITATPRKISDYLFQSQRGTVCDAAFLGRSSHSVKFEGSLILYNGTYNDNHLVVADLQFSADSMLWLNTSYLPEPGRHAVLDGGSLIVATGWYDPAIFSNGSGLLAGAVYILDWPAASSFASFGIVSLT